MRFLELAGTLMLGFRPLRHADEIDVLLDRFGQRLADELRPGRGGVFHIEVVPVISAAPSAIFNSLS